MSVVKGQNFLVYAGGVAESYRVAYSRTCTLEVTEDTQEVSGSGTGEWKHYIPMKVGWKVSVAGLVDSSRNDRTLFSLLKDRTAVTLFYKHASDGHYYCGSAYLVSLQQTAENVKLSTYTAEFQGSGELESI